MRPAVRGREEEKKGHGGSRMGAVGLGVALVLLAGPAASKGPKCFPREGRCVLVQVNGQRNVKLSNESRKTLRDLEEATSWADDARYEIPDAVSGELDVRADGVAGSEGWFGTLQDVDVEVVPLQDVELESHREEEREPSVRIGGAAAVTEQDVLDENRLPPGRYLLVVTLRGAKNWDRQVTYLEVE